MTEDDLISKAEKAAARLEVANAKMEDLVKRQEAIEARQEAAKILGGRSQAGVPSPEVSEEERMRTDMKNYFKGSAIEKALR